MVETMMDANGAGLAAPQVHVPLRVVVFQAPGERTDPGLAEDGALRPHRPPDRADQSGDRGPGPETGRRLGRLPVGAGPARLGRAAAHIRYRGLGLDGKTDRAHGARLSRPGGAA